MEYLKEFKKKKSVGGWPNINVKVEEEKEYKGKKRNNMRTVSRMVNTISPSRLPYFLSVLGGLNFGGAERK